jgi:glycerate-2-kinase
MEPRWSLKRSKTRGESLLASYFSSLEELRPKRLITDSSPQKNLARLFWGKSADDFHSVFSRNAHSLVISPKTSEHPIPGLRSFRMGKKLIRFFSTLEKNGISRLDVYLSGGASSLAWVVVPGLTEQAVVKRLKSLYRRDLDIRDLNRARAKLCQLKAGGAARRAKAVYPRLKIRVFYVSDVEPYGAEVLGSGPFQLPKIPHKRLADNSTLRRSLTKRLRGEDRGFLKGSIFRVLSEIRKQIGSRLGRSSPEPLIFGAEPSIRLPRRYGRGGRQTHFACLLLREFFGEIQNGRLEVLCMSSDGVDGTSGGSGVLLTANNLVGIDPKLFKKRLARSLKLFSSGSLLDSIGALIPKMKTQTNVQDIIVVRTVRGRSKNRRNRPSK